MVMQPAVFLDLDKTIIADPEEQGGGNGVVLIKGAAPAVASLRGLGYRIVVVANHEGVARGIMNEDDVEQLHDAVSQAMKATANGALIDRFYYCPFHPKGVVKQYAKDHDNRKPKPGMLTQAAEEMSLDLSMSWMIGDELADIQAGHAAGTRTILLRPDADRLRPVDPETIEGVKNEKPDRERPAGPDFYAVSLIDAARLIAQQPRTEQAEQKERKGSRKWDAAKIAKLQVPRPKAKADTQPVEANAGQARPPERAFRPWGAPSPDNDSGKPIVAKPYRKRQASNVDGSTPQASAADTKTETNTSEPPVSAMEEAKADIPSTIREAIRKKKKAADEGGAEAGEQAKLLRLILQELRAQRGQSQEFSFLTIVAVALQLIAIICLLGGLFMGSGDDGLFLRWLGTALVAQLMGIATMMYGR